MKKQIFRKVISQLFESLYTPSTLWCKYQVQHLLGKRNIAADVMSRYPPMKLEEGDEVSPDYHLYNAWLIERVGKRYESHLTRIYEVLLEEANGENNGDEKQRSTARFRLGEEGSLL
ncbi:hypothetical protein BD560DRAFT_428948, partial [Blakeslea trispora]